MEGKIACDIL